MTLRSRFDMAARMKIALILLGLVILRGEALAQTSTTLTLAGQASTGADQRPASFEFLCSSNRGANIHGVLGVSLIIPAHDTLRAVFAFDDFEGPDARAGRRTRVESSAAAATGSLRTAVSGSITGDAGTAFTFGINAVRRGDAAALRSLSQLLAPLTEGEARLVWTQGNTRAGGPEIIARLAVGAADAARLRTLIAPCLAR
jgi:hypothetical protein